MPSVAVEREARVCAIRQRSFGMHGHLDRVEYGPASPDFWEALSRYPFPGCCWDCGGPLAASDFAVGGEAAFVCCRCGTHYSLGGWTPPRIAVG